MRRIEPLMVVAIMGCAGDGPAVPDWLLGTSSSNSSTWGSIADSSESSASTAQETASASTGSPAECGNDQVEAGEDCDGTNWNGSTCESLGYSGNGLMCVECQLDVSGCGPVPGMIEVPGGLFEMGSDSPNEAPTRWVWVNTFWIDGTEVTVAEYAACMAAGACSEPATDPGCNWQAQGSEDHPVTCVYWFQAEGYCAWVDDGTKRLPTEAEWEKAARGTDGRTYPWGDMPEPSCSYVVMADPTSDVPGCGNGSATSVGSKPLGASPDGVRDMAGNVWEWVADWYAAYDAEETDNPTGPDLGTDRVARGGSWHDSYPSYFRTSWRAHSAPTHVANDLGFRCARTPPGST